MGCGAGEDRTEWRCLKKNKSITPSSENNNYKLKSLKGKRNQSDGRRENQRLNRKLGAKNKKRERRNAESLLFGASPEGLTTTASLSHLFSRCV